MIIPSPVTAILYLLPLTGWLASVDSRLKRVERECYFVVGSLLALGTPLFWQITAPLSCLMVAWYLSDSLRSSISWRHRRQQLRRKLSPTLELIGTVVQSGIPFSSALEYVAKRSNGIIKHELLNWVREMHLGGSSMPAIKRSAQEWKIPALNILATTLSISAKSGGSLAPHLKEIAASLKSEIAHEERVRTLTLNARLQGYFAIPIPIITFIFMAHFEPTIIKSSLRDPVAQQCYLLAIALQGIGAIWILNTGRRK